MLLQALGSLGLGLVTGWLAGRLVLPWPAGPGIPWRRVAVLGISLGSLGAVVIAWAGWMMAILFLIAAATSFLVYRSWLKRLSVLSSSH